MNATPLGNLLLLGVVLGVCSLPAGCQSTKSYTALDVPRELKKTTIPEYFIEPPDVLVVDMLRAVPIPPHRVEPLDLLFIQATGTPAEDPIKGMYRVETEGVVRFGPAYGSLSVVDMTVAEAGAAVKKHLEKVLKKTEVLLTVEQTAGIQQIRGEHLVRPDGTVSLGLYGRVYVTGKNQEDAREAIQQHLAKYFVKPKISLDIAGFNSHVYYIMFDNGGYGEQQIRMPFTGNETVLDAIGQVYGLPAFAAKGRIWIARPTGDNDAHDQVLPVDWIAITQRGAAATNYQIQRGDRVYVAANPLVTLNTYLGRLLAPVEQLFGVALLGSSTVSELRSGSNINNNGVR